MENIQKLFIAVIIAGVFLALGYFFIKNYFALPKKFWGAYTGNTPSSFIDFQQQVGETANMQAVFVGWYEPFSKDMALALKENNQTLVIFWEQHGVTLDKIITGESDSYIQQFSKDAESFGVSVILVPFHEMNGSWNPWSGLSASNSPEKVVLAWRHVHDLFPASPNIKWGWAVNSESAPDTELNQIENYYPGDNYTDYMGVDGFNFGNPWQSYSEIFSSMLEKLKKYKKPIYIFSMASAQGKDKAKWIKDALRQIRSDPSIEGFIWFNLQKERNWLVSSDPDSLRAFQKGIK